MADVLGNILTTARKVGHGALMASDPIYQQGQATKADIAYKKSLGRSRDINVILDRIKMAGGLETEEGRRIAATELAGHPGIMEMMERISPHRGLTPEQIMKARLYELGVTSRPGAVPWEAGELKTEKERADYAAALRRGRLESFKPPWEREFPETEVEPERKGGALDNIVPPSSERTTPISPRLQQMADEWLEPSQVKQPLIKRSDAGKAAVTAIKRVAAQADIAKFLKPKMATKTKRITIAEIAPIFEKAEKNGISRLDLYKEADKLKDLDLTREELITAYDKLAEGFTAEDIIKHIKSKPKAWETP